MTSRGAVLSSDVAGSELSYPAASWTPEFLVPHSPFCIGEAYRSVNIGTAITYNDALYPTANRAFFLPFYAPANMIVVDAFAENGTVVAGNFDIGIYDDSLARIVSTGSTPQAGTSVLQKAALADTQLIGGRNYFMAFVASSGSARYLRDTSSGSTVNLAAIGCFQQDTALPLPANATAATYSAAYVPFFGFTTRTSF